MAGMFYSLQEVAKKLNKTEQQVKQMITDGKLREFRDGPNLLFKADEVEALTSAGITPSQEIPAPTEPEIDIDEISLAPEPTEESPSDADEIPLAPEPSEQPPKESELTDAETVMADADTIMADEAINVLGETDSARQVSDDTMGETAAEPEEVIPEKVPEEATLASPEGTSLEEDMLGETKATSEEAVLEEIEEDVNLDTFGSGSGLLDLSLQADDTSLGDILDEIYTPEGEDVQETAEADSALEAPVDTEQMLAESGIAVPQPSPITPTIAQPYIEPEADKVSNALGIMLSIPIIAIIYTAIVAIAGRKGLSPGILKSIQGMVWYIMVGLIVVAALIAGVPVLLSQSAAKAASRPKTKKEKTKKPKKKKEKKKE